MHIHSNVSYLSKVKVKSRMGGYFYLSSPFQEPLTSISELPPTSGSIHVLSIVLKNVIAYASEAEIGALFLYTKETATLRTMLEEMGHPDPPTPIVTDKKCAAGIANDTVKQKRSKAIDIPFFWIVDRVKQNNPDLMKTQERKSSRLFHETSIPSTSPTRTLVVPTVPSRHQLNCHKGVVITNNPVSQPPAVPHLSAVRTEYLPSISHMYFLLKSTV